ncbi:MAG: metal-dependent transcriptional regulator [Candidatus Thermoplasmatota archaeon]|nr:metal-dependent transcriptional regulator [Candidatus Thermoplasmatota archaeon]
MASERTEDYLEVLDTIIAGKGYAQIKDVSRILGVRPSSVTEMVQKLHKAGYINYEKYSGITLTAEGKKIAQKTKKKHETLKKFLHILGVDEKIAEMDACRIEHIVNSQTMDRLTKFVEFVNKNKDTPRWLDHFNYYYDTGKYIQCQPQTEKQCPVHKHKK